MNKPLSYLISLLTPLVLLGFALRVLLTPVYYTVEYNMPYFPADPYGFTKEDRLRWAKPSVEYLVNNADISYLARLKFDNGQPIYNERELKHMEDVKAVVKGSLLVWYIALAIVFGTGLLARKRNWHDDFLLSLQRGGLWVIYFAAALGLTAGAGILINPNIFWAFFEGFHKIFFEGDSWLFFYSDTLIRLFPIRFWQDAFLWAAIIALSGGAWLAFGMRRK